MVKFLILTLQDPFLHPGDLFFKCRQIQEVIIDQRDQKVIQKTLQRVALAHSCLTDLRDLCSDDPRVINKYHLSL